MAVHELLMGRWSRRAYNAAMTSMTRPMSPEMPGPKIWVIGCAAILLLGGMAMLGDAYGWRHAALYAVGGALGIVLYHATFGFTSAWRAFLVDGNGAGLRAQMVMLAIATAAFLPALAQGSLFGQPVGGAFANAGTSVAVGAFIFGIGMQLGGGCASGTLFTVGGGSTRMFVTLVFFVAGSVIATAHAPWWYGLPGLGTVSLGRALGLWPALVVQLGLFAAIYLGTLAWERRGSRSRERPTRLPSVGQRIWRGPWPLIWGAVGLAVLNILTLLLAGHPWSITFAYSLWGAKIMAGAGVEVAAWEFWTWPYPARALSASVLADVTSVMNFGIIFGALLAAGLAGRFAPFQRVPAGPLAAAVIGGLLLGYGARLAFGCNIGAFFSGVASGSLHGWLWLVTALAGNWVGVRLRPIFRL